MSPSGRKQINEIRYIVHLAQQRIANRIVPSRRAVRRNLLALGSAKLHWGCGKKRIDGWINIDGWRSSATDYVHDLRTKLPFSDCTVDLIFTEHVLEHLEFDVAKFVMADFYRILKVGAKIRLIVPDLEKCCQAYLASDKSWFSIVDPGGGTPAESFNRVFYSHFHRFIYDYETLSLILREAGFSKVIRSSHLGSASEQVNFDTDEQSRILCSLYVEAEK